MFTCFLNVGFYMFFPYYLYTVKQLISFMIQEKDLKYYKYFTKHKIIKHNTNLKMVIVRLIKI